MTDKQLYVLLTRMNDELLELAERMNDWIYEGKRENEWHWIAEGKEPLLNFSKEGVQGYEERETGKYTAVHELILFAGRSQEIANTLIEDAETDNS